MRKNRTRSHARATDVDVGRVDFFAPTGVCLTNSRCRRLRVDCNADPHASVHFDPTTDCDRYAHGNINRYANTNSDCYANTNPNADCYANPNPDCYANADSNTDCYVDAHSNCDAGLSFRRPARARPECAIAPEWSALRCG